MNGSFCLPFSNNYVLITVLLFCSEKNTLFVKDPKANGPSFIYCFLGASHFKSRIPLPTEVGENISHILWMGTVRLRKGNSRCMAPQLEEGTAGTWRSLGLFLKSSLPTAASAVSLSLGANPKTVLQVPVLNDGE